MVRCFSALRCSQFVERHRAAVSFVCLVVGYVVYLLVGAGVFASVEQPYEAILREELRTARRNFLTENTCVSDARLEELLTRALEASNYGVSVLDNDTEPSWDFVSSLFFTSTVLTTTGYGHTAPLSEGGKAFCIFYSLLGIPATLLFLSAVVQRIMVVVTRGPVAYLHRRWGIARATVAAVHAVCLSIIMAVFFLFIPAWIFISMEEDWSYLESLYFCFISLTTIGLGDYVPGETHSRAANPHRTLYRLIITGYLLLGLVCMLVVLETCCELPQTKSLRQRFYKEHTRDLDSDMAAIIDQEQLDDPMADDPVIHQLPVISSVSEQAASLRQESKPPPPLPSRSYTAGKASTPSGDLLK